MPKRFIFFALLLSYAVCVVAEQYCGRVVDCQGKGIAYATVYPESDPVAGAATNDDGLFTIETSLTEDHQVIISFIGYEKQRLPLALFRAQGDTAVVVLREQPIALEETVVAAKPAKQRNKRKQMAALLHSVYVQMEHDFADTPARYHVVSDVRMDSEGEAWGMEQMIASIVVLPEAAKEGRDSTQFVGEYCKRFFKPAIRALADTILAGDGLERIDKDMRKAANAVDSGVVVHHTLFSMGNVRYDFEEWVDDVRHWTVSNESEGETVLTHTEKHNYLGIVKYTVTRHYILDSETLSVRRFSEYGEGQVNIPFGMRLDEDQLQLLNLFNMDSTRIEKFRLRKMRAKVHLNTIYQRRDGALYILERNLRSEGMIVGTRKMEIPVEVSATQRVTTLETEGVTALPASAMTKRVKRQIVEIY